MPSSFWFALLLLTAMAIAVLSAAPTIQDSNFSTQKGTLSAASGEYDSGAMLEVEDSKRVMMRHGHGRYLAQKTCNIYPRVCKAKGSAGPDCCYKQCVDVKTDRRNCGKCGRKCKYGEICCQGQCVNPSFNKKHCGQCNHKCNRGTSCIYGLCSYA